VLKSRRKRDEAHERISNWLIAGKRENRLGNRMEEKQRIMIS
jgi:hypothetical protein